MHLAAQTTSVIEGPITDLQGLAITGAEITLSGPALAREIHVISDPEGSFRIPGLPAGTYRLRVEKPGFATQVSEGLEVPVNRVLPLKITLAVGAIQDEITVSADPLLIDTTVSSSGATILPQQIELLPLNGRNYLDLMLIVPGVTVNRRVDKGTDNAVPVLGERGGNTVFLIDGMPNSNAIDGGAAAPFDQDSILEFQVLTAGYEAEFGHGSGGIVNVVSKSGTSEWHGLASAFHRDNTLDSSDIAGASTPFLHRWDGSANLAGPLQKDRMFFFGSVERIRETRELNFTFPPGVPGFLQVREEGFDKHNQTFETRSFLKLDEQLGPHRVTGQMNLTNSHIADFLPLSQATSLPSTRANLGSRQLLFGLHDTAALGGQSSPFLLNSYFQYRGEPFAQRASHPEASPATTLFNMFSSLTTSRLTGDLGQVKFGAGFTPLLLRQKYISTGAHLNKVIGAHDIKFGWDFQRTLADGVEAGNLLNQLFATVSDCGQFGPVDSGLYVLRSVAGRTPDDNLIRLRNSYDGLFAQDDWKISKTLTLNAGLRWDNDSHFPNRLNFSPRLGLAWSPVPSMVISASWGVFYDNYRLGLARDVPGLGGANLFTNQAISFPRLFYGDPTTLAQTNGLCPSPVLTDAEIASAGTPCPVAGMPLLGVDHLNAVVAPGRAPIPANTVVSLENVQSVTGLTPQQFADQASAAVGRPPGFFFWGGFGHLSMNFIVPRSFAIPITVASDFKTPYTRALHTGAQRKLGSNVVIQGDYYHRNIQNMIGVRTTNLAFEARMPGNTGKLQPGTGTRPILSYGPWYEGAYDAVSVGLRKRMGKRFSLEANYAWTHAIDNALNSNLVSEVQTGLGAGSLAVKGPTDSFVGVPPVVTDPVSGRTNASSSFIARNGNPVPKAGKFYNGPDLDRGPSDLALNHTLLLDGIARLPWKVDVSGIFRAQSGFHFTGAAPSPVDVDGDGILNGVDFLSGRNHFQAPADVNLDMHFSKGFGIRERVRVRVVFEFFNLLNRANPAAVEQLENVTTPLGRPLQFLPGREGQAGLRIEF